MTFTEEEAKLMWCPMIRVGVTSGHAGSAVNTYPDPHVEAECSCRASRCAMWRWNSHLPNGTPPVGYCGLAGKP